MQLGDMRRVRQRWDSLGILGQIAFLTLIATILAGLPGYLALRDTSDGVESSSSVPPSPTEYDRLAKLETNIQLSAFSKTMGVQPKICRRQGTARSCIYVRPNEYVQVVVDRDNQVQSFAVTSRKPDFNPEFPIFQNKIKLGKTSISDAIRMMRRDAKPDKLRGWGGATGHYQYLEAINSDHTLNFQEYAVGISER
jgi:hypothetical protein